ncbi:conserved hypothetical protein [Culex quinquefasciatus]|uniref:Uncharacterized protein n=1 Tax=Culex quinquefasciatus TaxID=7176 RepID=B0WFP4_CULQU|nr:conserved hypothetical protein [Culex quinquefasciatus]|eukprot:XP_001847528.1 conserved hypothetical protein [Culex quinquefasciatus]
MLTIYLTLTSLLLVTRSALNPTSDQGLWERAGFYQVYRDPSRTAMATESAT